MPRSGLLFIAFAWLLAAAAAVEDVVWPCNTTLYVNGVITEPRSLCNIGANYECIEAIGDAVYPTCFKSVAQVGCAEMEIENIMCDNGVQVGVTCMDNATLEYRFVPIRDTSSDAVTFLGCSDKGEGGSTSPVICASNWTSDCAIPNEKWDADNFTCYQETVRPYECWRPYNTTSVPWPCNYTLYVDGVANGTRSACPSGMTCNEPEGDALYPTCTLETETACSEEVPCADPGVCPNGVALTAACPPNGTHCVLSFVTAVDNSSSALTFMGCEKDRDMLDLSTTVCQSNGPAACAVAEEAWDPVAATCSVNSLACADGNASTTDACVDAAEPYYCSHTMPTSVGISSGAVVAIVTAAALGLAVASGAVVVFGILAGASPARRQPAQTSRANRAWGHRRNAAQWN